MLESDRREIWRYGQLQRETQGIGLVLVKVRGKGVDVGDPELPVFYPGWLRSDGGLVEARRSLVK